MIGKGRPNCAPPNKPPRKNPRLGWAAAAAGCTALTNTVGAGAALGWPCDGCAVAKWVASSGVWASGACSVVAENTVGAGAGVGAAMAAVRTGAVGVGATGVRITRLGACGALGRVCGACVVTVGVAGAVSACTAAATCALPVGGKPHIGLWLRSTRGTQLTVPPKPARRNTQPRLSTNCWPVKLAPGGFAGPPNRARLCASAVATATAVARTAPDKTLNSMVHPRRWGET